MAIGKNIIILSITHPGITNAYDMVTIKKQDDNFIFEVKGMHKLWAFKAN